jgi:hypothetical protein
MKHIIAYSPPYGENYLKELEVFSFMHSCGINGVKLILSNSFSALGIPYSPYPLIWRGPGDYDFSIVDRQISENLAVQLDVGFLETVHKAAVIHIQCAAGGIDTHDPESAVLLLFLLTSDVGVTLCAFDCIIRIAEVAAAVAIETLSLLKQTFTTFTGRNCISNSRHFSTPSLN